MGILRHFLREMNRTLDIYPKENSFDSQGRTIEAFTVAPSATGLKAAVWEGSSAESLVADRYKALIDAVAVTVPGVAIPDGAKVIVNDGRVFYAIHLDDIMSLGEVAVTGLQNGK
jgi:hypothetical protein